MELWKEMGDDESCMGRDAMLCCISLSTEWTCQGANARWRAAHSCLASHGSFWYYWTCIPGLGWLWIRNADDKEVGSIFSISMEIPFFSKVVFNPFMQRSFYWGGESSTIVAFALSFILKVESFLRIVTPICALFYLRGICRIYIYICTSSLLCYIVCGILSIFTSICIKVVNT